jgi:hypothetical protein
MRHLLIAIVAAVLMSGCDNPTRAGGDDDFPPVVSIVAPDGLLFLGESYSFSMSARSSNGSVVTTGGTWGSDAPSVATVEASGRVQVVGIGEATIYVDFQGVRATKRVRTTVNYAGTLDGGYQVTGCSETGAIAAQDLCKEAPNGTVFGYQGTFTQTGETVVATMDLIEFPAEPVSATVNSAGELRFQTEHREELLIATAEWIFRPSGLRQVQGSVVIRMRVIGVSGTLTLRGNLLPDSIARFDAPAGTSMRPSLRQLQGLQRALSAR